MSRRPRPRFAAPRPGRAGIVSALLLAALIALLAGCAGQEFDPTGPCTTDGKARGAYPELEAAVPTAFNAIAPSNIDSGRACTAAGLGTLTSHGVAEIRFAGATWELGSDSGVSLGVFTAPSGSALQTAWIAEFYETGARGGKNVASVETTDYPVTASIQGRRIDVLNGESYQSIVVWERNGLVAVALVANAIRSIGTKEAHDRVVRSAVDAFAG